MSDTIKQAGIKQADGTYLMKDIGVDYTNVDGLSTAAKSFEAFSADKATADKNNKDITEYVASISKNGENISVQSGDPTATPVDVDLSMTGATAVDNGEAGFVPQPTVADNAKFLRGDGTWAIPQDITYTGSDNIEIDGTTNAIDLTDSTVSSGTYGPSADVTGSNGVAILVPKFTVDAKGRLTSAGTQTYTSVDTTYSAGTGLSLSGTSFSLGSHASTGTGYGQGSGRNFGHVKLNDTYASLVSGADAAGGVAASQNALYNAYNTLNGRLTQVMFNNAGAHNAIYRGKNLGTSVTAEQWAVITAGTFDDLYIGDYWVINGKTWRIAAFDYFLHNGDTECTTHHAVIVPDECLYNAQMNTKNDTTGGYFLAKYRGVLTDAETAIKATFGTSHILSHRVYLTNAVANGKPSGGAWVDTICDLMNEEMVYGTGIFRPTSDGSTVPTNHRVEKSQLPLFAHEPSRIINRADCWLRDVVAATVFAIVSSSGLASGSNASISNGVRPAFCIS